MCVVFGADDDNVLMAMENLTVFADNTEDPYVTNKDSDGSEEGVNSARESGSV